MYTKSTNAYGFSSGFRKKIINFVSALHKPKGIILNSVIFVHTLQMLSFHTTENMDCLLFINIIERMLSYVIIVEENLPPIILFLLKSLVIHLLLCILRLQLTRIAPSSDLSFHARSFTAERRHAHLCFSILGNKQFPRN